MLIIFLLILYPGRYASSPCFDLNSTSNLCHLCSYDYFKNGSFDWEQSDYDPKLCSQRGQAALELDIFVDSSFDCQSLSCNGSIQAPFSDLFIALQNIHRSLLNFSSSNISVFLKGDNPHYLYTNLSLTTPFFLFRRIYTRISIQPFLCKFKALIGCSTDDQKISEILIKSSDVIFFISNQLSLKNVKFNGVDIPFYSRYPDKAFKEEKKSSQFCTNGDLLVPSVNIKKRSCYISNQSISMSDQAIYGLLNLETLVDCSSCVAPSLEILSCEFLNFFSLSGSFRSLNSLINLMMPSDFRIVLNATKFSRFFLYRGILNVLQLNDTSYYKYVNPRANLSKSLKTWNISFNSSFFYDFNPYSQSFSQINNRDFLALIRLIRNSSSADIPILLNLRLENTVIYAIQNSISLANFDLAFVVISGFNSSSLFSYQNGFFFNNSDGFFVYLFDRFQNIVFSHTRFIMNSNFSMFLGSNNSMEFSFNSVDSLIITQFGFFQVLETLLNITNCNFINIYSSDVLPLIVNRAIYSALSQYKLRWETYSFTKIFFKSCSFYSMNVSMIQTEQTILLMSLQDCNFTSIFLSEQCLFSLDVDLSFNLSNVKLSNIISSGFLFSFSYSRDKYFSRLVLSNSSVGLYRAKITPWLKKYVVVSFDNVIATGITVTTSNFFELILFWNKCFFSKFFIRNSHFEDINLQAFYANTPMFTLNKQILIQFDFVVFSNIQTSQVFLNSMGLFAINFTNSIFDHGENYLDYTGLLYINNCSFRASVTTTGFPAIIMNSIFQSNDINTKKLKDGILIFLSTTSVKILLIYNCTFFNNTIDVFQEIHDRDNSPDMTIDENFMKANLKLCYLLGWTYDEIVYSYQWCSKITVKTMETVCPNDDKISGNFHIMADLNLNLTEINTIYQTLGFDFVNCAFIGTLTQVFNLEERVSIPLLLLRNCTLKDIYFDKTVIFYSYNCIMAIFDTKFINISSKNGQLGYVSQSQIYFRNVEINSAHFTNQMKGLFNFEGSNITLQNVTCRNITTRHSGLIYGKRTNYFSVINVTVEDCFSYSGCSMMYLWAASVIMTDIRITRANSNYKGAVCLEESSFINISRVSIDQGNIGFWISKGDLYYSSISSFVCADQTGDLGICIYLENAILMVENATFVRNHPVKSVIYSNSNGNLGLITLNNLDFSENSLGFSGITIENSDLGINNLTFIGNLFDNAFIYATTSFISINSTSFDLRNTGDDQGVNSQKNIIYLTNSTLQGKNMNFHAGKSSKGVYGNKGSYLYLENSLFSECLTAIVLQDSSAVSLKTTIFSGNPEGAVYLTDSSFSAFSVYFFGNSFEASEFKKGCDIWAYNSQDQAINLWIQSSNFSSFEGTSIYVEGSFNYKMCNISYLNVSLQNSQAIYALNPRNISLQGLKLVGFISSTAIEIITNFNYLLSIAIDSSTFEACASNISGGALNIQGNNVTLKITNCVFQENSAKIHGGAVYFMCFSCSHTDFISSLLLKNNRFFRNTAGYNGGALKLFAFNYSDVISEGNLFDGNVALVGNDLAGEVKQLCVTLDSALLNPLNTTFVDELSGVSGNYSSFLVLLFDEIDNFLSTENAEKIGITTPDELKLVENVQTIRNGLSNFTLYTYAPSSTLHSYTLNIFHSKYTSLSKNITITLRSCVRGENSVNSQCIQCVLGYYSLDVGQPCTICPAEKAFCPGRDLLIPEAGYWRFHENSSLLVRCTNTLSCPAQKPFYLISKGDTGPLEYNFHKRFQYVCGEGSYGSLCSNCERGFGLSSTKACTRCQVNYFSIFLILFNFIVLLYQTLTAFKAKEDISRSLMKILINHNNYLGIVEYFQSNIGNSNFATLLSFNQQISVVGAITDSTVFDCFLQKYVEPQDIVMARIIVFSIFPLFVIIALMIVRLFPLIFPRLRRKIQEKSLFSIFISCFILVIYSFYPKLVSNCFSLLKCISLDNSQRTFLEIEPNIECWSETHRFKLLAIFLPNLIIWCIGWPLMIGMTLVVKKKNEESTFRMKKSRLLASIRSVPQVTNPEEILQSGFKTLKTLKSRDDKTVILADEEKDEIFQKNKFYRFLTSEYHFSAYAWDEFFFGTNLLLNVFALSSNAIPQTVFATILMTVFFVMIIVVTTFNPFRYKENNVICSISYCALLSTFYSVINLTVLGGNEDIERTFYFGLIFVVNGLFYVIWIQYFLMKNWIQVKKIFMDLLKKKKKKRETTRKESNRQSLRKEEKEKINA